MTRDEWIIDGHSKFVRPHTLPDAASVDRFGMEHDRLCRLIDSRIAAAKSAEPPTYSRREPVADEDRPALTGERFGARIHNSSKNGKFLVDVGSASLSPTGRWYYYSDERGLGNFPTEAEARAALATAPPPPGWVETAKAVEEVTHDDVMNVLRAAANETGADGWPYPTRITNRLFDSFIITRRKPTP